MALAFALILGLVVGRTAPLPFACGSDGGCSNRTVIRSRIGQGRELGNITKPRSLFLFTAIGRFRR